ncbi:MAG: right-handed parallel beta-helix repeat-containing protein [Saprospiraceae bacterium]
MQSLQATYAQQPLIPICQAMMGDLQTNELVVVDNFKGVNEAGVYDDGDVFVTLYYRLPSASPSLSTSGIVGCNGQDPEYILAVSALGLPDCNDAISFTFDIPRPHDQIDDNLIAGVPTVTSAGSINGVNMTTTTVVPRVSAMVSDQVETITFNLLPDNFNEYRCGIIRIAYPTSLPATPPLPAAKYSLATNTRLTLTRGSTCIRTGQANFPSGTNTLLWDYQPGTHTGPQMRILPQFVNQTITEIDLGAVVGVSSPFNPAPSREVLINGQVTFAGTDWVSANSGVSFFMGPGAEFVFDPRSGIPTIVTNPQFIPCSTLPFSSVTIEEGADIIIEPSSASGAFYSPLVYGAQTGIVLKDDALFTMIGGEIVSCNIGLEVFGAQVAELIDVNIRQGRPTSSGQSPFVPLVGRGQVGITLRPGNRNEGKLNDFIRVNISDFNTGILGNRGYRPSDELYFTNSTIMNVNNGIDLQRMIGGELEVLNSSITAGNIGIRARRLPQTFINIEDNEIVAGTGAVLSDQPYFGTMATIHGNDISGFSDYGIQLTRRRAQGIVTGNKLRPIRNAAPNHYGIGIFGVNNGVTADWNTMRLSPVAATGIIANGSQSVIVNENDITYEGLNSVGLEFSNNSNVSTNCNLVVAWNAAAGRSSVGLLSQSDLGSSLHACNALRDMEYGLQMMGSSSNVQFRSNTLDNNDWGVAVGLDNGSQSQAPTLIGGQQFNTATLQPYDNSWSLAATNPRPRSAFHYTEDINLKRRNAFRVWQLPNLFPTAGNLANWFTISASDGTAIAACPAGCASFPRDWPIQDDGPCLPELESLSDEDRKHIQIQQARINAKSDYDSELQPCDNQTLECYTNLAEIEAAYLYLNQDDEATSSASWSSLAEDYTEQVHAGEIEAFKLVHRAAVSDFTFDAELSDLQLANLVAQLNDFSPCDDLSVLWHEALYFAILDEQGDITESQLATQYETASLCGHNAGPGVSIARAHLGLAISDAQMCDQGEGDVESMELRLASKPATAFPNPILAGQELTLPEQMSGQLVLTNSIGLEIFVQSIERTATVGVPNDLPSGLYILSITHKDAQPTFTMKLQVTNAN